MTVTGGGLHGMEGDYYERNAESFFDATVNVDMGPLYQRFLPLLPSAGRILDAGCGSGRDLRAFTDLGYRVTAFDASPALVALANVHAGQPVHCLRFEDIDWPSSFDGVWASASLLHISLAELPDTLRRLSAALVPGGILYASFKYGSGERKHDGRRFTDMDADGLRRLLRQQTGLEPLDIWITADRRPERATELWLNALVRRCG